MICYFCGKNIGICCGNNSSLKKYELDFERKVKICYECEVIIFSNSYCQICKSLLSIPFNKRTKRYQILENNANTILLSCNCSKYI